MILRASTVLLLLALMGCAAKAPVEPALPEAEEAVRRAEKAGAERYARVELSRAKGLIEKASQAGGPGERSELAARAKLYAQVAEIRSLYLSTLERLREVRSERARLALERMAERIREAEARMRLAEHRMRLAEKEAERAREEAAREVARARAETAISKAELLLKLAREAGAESLSKKLFSSASSKLDLAKGELKEGEYDEAERLAAEAEAEAEKARAEALRKAEARRREAELRIGELREKAVRSMAGAEALIEAAKSLGAQELIPSKLREASSRLEEARKAMAEGRLEEAASLAARAEKEALNLQRLAQMRWRERLIGRADEEIAAQAKDSLFKAERLLKEADRRGLGGSAALLKAEEAVKAAREALGRGEYREAWRSAELGAALAEMAIDAADEARKAEDEIISELSGLEGVELLKTPRGVLIRVSGDLFPPGGSEIRKAYLGTFERIASALKGCPYPILIEGHTDSSGDEEENLKLSFLRAVRVMEFLIKRGLDPARLTATGYGESRPIDSNATPEGRRRNRRVELIVLTRGFLRPF
ncbi:hypothetical protein DRP77_12030 [Candidatus Poribacteria bacterium]|nr:MAG: hypothetical protein DRP77_12030 [Candidatus Poribacteria bacterium]